MNAIPKPATTRIDEPSDIDPNIGWGSDIAAQMLRRLEIPYISLNPGASYRSLHDSLVNHLGNRMPEIIMCLHEDHAVSIAHGYAKVTGKPMAVALHSNVGLLHGAMGIYNAWCDRQPMLILGATGPVDATLRRPSIDWLHTAQDQGQVIRNFVKYDDQPGSTAAIPEAILRAWQQTATAPRGPVYVCLDVTLQEEKLAAEIPLPDPQRYRPAPAARPSAAAVREAAEALKRAKRPVMLLGRLRRSEDDWRRRVALAEKLGAVMLSDLKAGSMVPTDHPLHRGQPFNNLSTTAIEALRGADVILSLDWIDLGGALQLAFDKQAPSATVIHASQDMHLHNGFGKEHLELPPVDIRLHGEPNEAVVDLLEALGDYKTAAPLPATKPPAKREAGDTLNLVHIAQALKAATGDQPVSFSSLTRGWPVDQWPHRHHLDYLGKDGGGGIGSGPGITIGAALALRDSGRLAVGVLGDGDTMMGITAFWSAAHYQIPVLAIIANNRSYYNDELHQEGVALKRGRNVANRWIGQTLDHPAPDIAKIVEGQGVLGIGPIKRVEDLPDALRRGVAAVRAGKPCVIDVHIDPQHGRSLRESMQVRGTESH